MYLCPVAAILSLVYKSVLAAADDDKEEGRAGQRRRFSSSFADSSWKDSWKQSALVNKQQHDADLHNTILPAGIAKGDQNHAPYLRQRRRRARTAVGEEKQRDDKQKECDPHATIEKYEELDTGVLPRSSKDCPKNYICVPTEASEVGGTCVHSKTAKQRDLGTTEKDFCECLFYSEPLEEAACFDTVIKYCTASTPPACVSYDEFPYVWAYCDYFRCLNDIQNAGRRLASFTEEQKDSCWCGGYYGAVCYMCSPQQDLETGETFVWVDDEDFCEYTDATCTTVECCQGPDDAKTCLGNHSDGDVNYSDGPTIEPTAEPTVPPAGFGFVFNATEANRLASTCDPTIEMLLPQCNITDADVCTASPECRWRPLKQNCIGMCQDRWTEEDCTKKSMCAWDMEKACCAKAAPTY